MAAVNAVVVVLPFVPVIATQGISCKCRQASSISPIVFMPNSRAVAKIGISQGTPGLTTINLDISESVNSGVFPNLTVICSLASCCCCSRRVGEVLLSQSSTSQPSCFNNLAAATPDFPNPIINASGID